MKLELYVILGILLTHASKINAQCNGPALYILPNNNTGNIAMPESNLDPVTGAWRPDNYYPVNVACTWILKAPPLHVLYLKILYFDSEEKFDYIQLHTSEDRQNKLFQYSGSLKEVWEAVTPENTLVIDFFSDGVTTYNGFHIAYMYLPKACVDGGVDIIEDQLIALPPWNLRGLLPGPKRPGFFAPKYDMGTPLSDEDVVPAVPRWVEMSPYPQGLNCTWRVSVAPKKIVQIDVLKFQTDSDDVLQVWQIEQDKLKPLAKYMKEEIPQKQIQSSLPMMMSFVSHMAETGPNSGFLLNVSYATRGCEKNREVITTTRGYIGYPAYNLLGDRWLSNNPILYGPDACEWVIKAPKGYSLNVTLLLLDTKPQDLLEILENDESKFSYGGILHTATHFQSKGNEIIVRFNSKSDVGLTGFLLHYSWILNECKFNLQSEEGRIESPFYPESYGESVNCEWQLTPPPNFYTHVRILGLKLDGGDELKIQGGNNSVSFTQISKPTDFLGFEPMKSISISFTSDQTANFGRFLLQYVMFDLGSCNFSISTCGWTSKSEGDWLFKSESKMMAVEELPQMGYQLPRGHQAILESPVLPTPEKELCLSFQYILSGQDAFKLSVVISEYTESNKNNSKSQNYIRESRILDVDSINKENKRVLKEIQGTQGNLVLQALVNITVSSSFKILLIYERGYGPHYEVGISQIQLKKHACSLERSEMLSFSCTFNSSFCGWQNTNSDHRNWELGDGVLGAFTSQDIASFQANPHHQNQVADLISPVMDTKSILKGVSSKEIYIKFSFEIHTSLVEVQVLVIDRNEEPKNSNSFSKSRIIWSQGRIKSNGVLNALVPLERETLPLRFQIIIRGIMVGFSNPQVIPANPDGEFGVSLYDVEIVKNVSNASANCQFEDGFCSWSVHSTGKTVWHVKRDGSESFSAVRSIAPVDGTSKMISPYISAENMKSISFRYRMEKSNQCLRISLAPRTKLKNNIKTLWEQCKDKGADWLKECIPVVLDNPKESYQIIISSDTGHQDSIVWLDDIQVSNDSCRPPLQIKTAWKCDFKDTLCGMTQPHLGNWMWIGVTRDLLQKNRNQILQNKTVTNNHPMKDSKSMHHEPGNYNDLIQNAANHDYLSQNDGHMARNEAYENHIAQNDINHEYMTRNGDNQGHFPRDSADHDSITKIINNLGHLTRNMEDYSAMTQTDVNHGPISPNNNIPEAFICSDGRKLDPAWVCDGVPDCKDNSDEISCDHEAHPNNQWMNEDPNLYLQHPSRFYQNDMRSTNGIKAHGFNDRFPCSGGLLLPKAFQCDGRKDCPLDGLDEIGCFHCGLDEFLCPQSGVCLPSASVCDGISTIETCTDENSCQQCAAGQFACDVCILSNKLCDGVWDCMEGEDEIRCVDMTQNHPTITLESNKGYQRDSLQFKASVSALHEEKEGCDSYQYGCSDGRCISYSSVCDRRTDCIEEEDENDCVGDLTEGEFHLSAKRDTYNHRSNSVPSFVITPKFYHKENETTLLNFKYRLDSWIGATNITLSLELLDSEVGDKSLIPFALWRQSGDKGRHWLTADVIIPRLPNINQYKLGFLVIGESALTHNSEQIQITKLKFKSLSKEELTQIGGAWSTCEFKNSLCGWTQPYTDQGFSWIYSMASTHARRTGPITGYKHDKSSGFLFTDSLQGPEGAAADLLSPALQLEDESQVICFRLQAFMYGSHIGQLSIHIMQQTVSGHTYTNEVYQTTGGRGLSWNPVEITIGASTLHDYHLPFIIIIRSIRGTGSEADIAIDQLEFYDGGCEDKKTMDSLKFMKVPVDASQAYVRSLSNGRSFTPYIPIDNKIEGNLLSLNETEKNGLKLSVDCLNKLSCYECLTVTTTDCTWCGMSQSCHESLSNEARSCPVHTSLHSNSTADTHSGSKWCPRIAPNQPTQISVNADSLISVSIPVINIPVTQTKKDWMCRFTFQTKDEKSSENSPFLDFMDEISFLDKNSTNFGNLKDQIFLENLKKFNFQNRKESDVIEVLGAFQGTLYPTGISDDLKLGVGVVKCGDDETLMKLPNSQKMSTARVELKTSDGYVIDNPEDVQLLVYRCEEIAEDCETCVRLNRTFNCGWCSVTDKCSSHSDCIDGLWKAHSDSPNRVCVVQDKIDILRQILETGAENGDEDYARNSSEDGANVRPRKGGYPRRKKRKNESRKDIFKKFKKSLKKKSKKESDRVKGKSKDPDNESKSRTNKAEDEKNKKEVKEKSPSGKSSSKVNKKSRGKGFIKIPSSDGVFLARDIWRLHTGRQYYIPVTKKTLINLGFVRHVNYGSLSEEKSRTVLMDGSWKKAAGYYIDLFEKAGREPMASIITNTKEVYDKLLKQLLPE